MKLIKFDDKFINIDHIVSIWKSIGVYYRINMQTTSEILDCIFNTEVECDEAFKNLLKELHEI